MKTLPRFLCLLTLAAAAPAAGADDRPRPGTVRTLRVATVALEVGSTDRDSKRVVYAPPPGWYIRSHRVVCEKKYGVVAYAVSTVPAGWNWVSDERTRAASKSAAGATVTAYHFGAGGQAAAASDATSADRQLNTSSHHLLVVDVSARGQGLFLGGGGVNLTVYAEMVYLGTDRGCPCLPPAQPGE